MYIGHQLFRNLSLKIPTLRRDFVIKIALNLQFCQEYMYFLPAEKVLQRLAIHNIEKSKQITSILHQNMDASEL